MNTANPIHYDVPYMNGVPLLIRKNLAFHLSEIPINLF